MEQTGKVVTRKQLYEQVWSQPVSILAKEYGLSDVGLAKICKKHEIPRPSLGYWARKQYGQTPPVVSLPDPERNPDIEIRPHDRAVADPGTLKELEKADLEEPVPVPESLRGAHPLIRTSLEKLEVAELNGQGLIDPPQDECLMVRVSRDSLRRALRILDGLIKALETRGYAVAFTPKRAGAIAKIMGQDVGFEIEEALEPKKVEEEPGDLQGYYHFRHSSFRRSVSPNGKLKLLIDGDRYSSGGLRRQWSDGKRTRLEDVLGSVLAGMIARAAKLVEREREEEERKKQLEREERKRLKEQQHLQELAAQVKAERKRVDGLLEDAENWKTSRTLREYVSAVKASAIQQGRAVGLDTDLGKWIAWANQQADRIDPQVESPPSILDRESEVRDCETRRRNGWY